jgi:hypothetical protein
LSRLDELDLSTGKKSGASAGSPPDLAGASLSGTAAGSPAETPGLVDLPLVAAAAPVPGRVILRTPSVAATETAEAAPPALDGDAAPLSARGAAFAADAALVLLLAAAALLAATAGRGQPLRLQGLFWTAAFAFYLSFFSTVVPLILFGKTVGMALTGLTARGRSGPPLTARESARRWLGTALTVAGLGVPLVVTRRRREAPSPGDRLSGRPLTLEDVERS